MPFVSLVLIILASIAVSYLIWNYRHYRSSIKITNSLPGPKTFPLIGNAYYFLWQRSDDFLDIMIKLGKDYSSPIKFLVGNKLFVGIYEPDQIQVILQNSGEKSTIYKFFEPIFGFGLITAPVSTWTKDRKIMAPCFTTIALQKFFNVFVEQSLILTDQLEKIVLNRNKIILFNHIAKYALRTVCGTMTNIKTEFSSNQINQFLEIMARSRKIITSRFRNVFLHSNFIFNLTAMGREQQKNIDFFHSFTDKIIQQHVNSQNINNKSGTSYKTFLDILIEISHKDKFPQEMIHDNLITILLAGTDTTAVTIDFAILMLANFPEIQKKVYQELWEIYKTETPKSAPIKYEDLQHMDYLDCVIKETMRLFPAAPIIARYLTSDVKIGEFILPKGAEVILGIIALHRHEKYWPNPLVFDPDRFLPEKIGTSYKCYMPFSYGSRNCIGMKYAMISIKVVLATLIRTFVFKIEKSIQIDKMKLNTDIALSNIEPIEVIIEKRELH